MQTCLTPFAASAADASHQPQSIQGLNFKPRNFSVARELPSAAPQKLRVLVLDDNVELARVLRSFFEMNGHQVEVAHCGQEALRLLAGQPFHLAMVDIDLPDSTGFEVVAQATTQGQLKNTKVLFCSGYHSHERTARSGQFPGSRFLCKPFRMSEMFEEIHEMFTETNSSTDPHQDNN